jgi:hypothetical protein
MSKAQARKRAVEANKKMLAVLTWYYQATPESSRGITEKSILNAMNAVDKVAKSLK